MLTPAFHFNILLEFVGIFVEHGEDLVKDLKAKEGEIVKDLIPFLTKYTLNAPLFIGKIDHHLVLILIKIIFSKKNLLTFL